MMTYAFTLGCLAEVNPLQTWQYVRNGFTADGYELGVRCRPDDYLSVDGYRPASSFTTPELDRAWWIDPGRPELLGFGGWWVDVMTVERELSRDWRVIQGLRPTARPGPLKDDGYVITLEGDLHGATCCATSAGWAALQEAITRQCDPCIGTTLQYLTTEPVNRVGCAVYDDNSEQVVIGGAAGGLAGDAVLVGGTAGGGGTYLVSGGDDEGPGDGALLVKVAPDALVPSRVSAATPWRTMFGIAISEAPSIVATYGSRCPSCLCGQITRVRMVLRAQPGKFSSPRTLAVHPIIPSGAPVTAYAADAPCTATTVLSDPLSPSIAPPPRPPTATSPTTSVAQSFVATSSFTVNTSNSVLFSTVGVIQLYAGSTALRNLRVRWWREIPGAPMSAYDICEAWDGVAIPWLPAGYTLTLDGRADVAALQSPAGEVSEGRDYVRSVTGAPWSGAVELPPGRWVVKVQADPSHTAATAEITLAGSLVEP